MFTKILVPTDGSPLSDKAVAGALDLAAKVGAALIVISVAEPYRYIPPAAAGMIYDPSLYSDELQHRFDQHSQEQAREIVEKVMDAARARGVACEAITPMSLNPYEEIVNAVDRYGCDAVFMASHGRKGLNKLFLGSETQKVLSHTSVPVMVFR
ncbi:MAG: universal stress protein [Cellvibrio sp.]|jgi:nucleotide-binding universal stress UspA family protein